MASHGLPGPPLPPGVTSSPSLPVSRPMSRARSAIEKADKKAARKALGLPVRGDAEAGRATTSYAPRGGRNSGGRGGGR